MNIKDLRVNKILKQIKQDCIRIFKENLVGVYVHGSIAFGCFCWENSDIDFLVVVREKPGLKKKEELIWVLLELDAQCPKKGLEMSVVQEQYCRNFIYPTPFELHFSNAYKEKLFKIEQAGFSIAKQNCFNTPQICRKELCEYCRTMNGTDHDLAAHFTVLRAVGFPLCGKDIFDVFGEVPRENYLDSIWLDIAQAKEEIVENPVYVILNLCRVLAFLKEGLICSKIQGSIWALEYLSEDFAERWLIKRAEECYRTGKEWRKEEILHTKLKVFAAAMLKEICCEKEK